MPDLDRDAYEKILRGPDDPLAVTVTLAIRLHRSGALSVEGPIADKAFCRRLLDEAWDAIKRQQRDVPDLVVPGGDVDSRARENYAVPA
jgi:hypothetical protein